jgi:predicted O-methyltransferase YrrM
MRLQRTRSETALRLKEWIAKAPVLAPIGTFASRLRSVVRRVAEVSLHGVRWLGSSREHTNFTYDLTEVNIVHLAWWVAGVAGISVEEARAYLAELAADHHLQEHHAEQMRASSRRAIGDVDARFGRRAGWYALVRALEPDHVVETGTDKGLGSLAIAAALLRNGHGRLTTIDRNPEAGFLIAGPYLAVVDLRTGDSADVLADLNPGVDFFIHDSNHSPEFESQELALVEPKLTADALVLSDNAHAGDALVRWAERTGRRFAYFQETPRSHWYPGAGIGAAWRSPST